jgi:hypothetical protein
MFALALRIGCTVDELLNRLSVTEYREWLAYADMGDPLLDLQADQKADYRTGLEVFWLVKLLSGTKRKFNPSDFAPQWVKEKKPQQTGEQMKRAAMKFAASFKGK